MLLHVTGARHVLRRDIDDAEIALREAEDVGRSALQQIRTTVALLRTDETGTDPALAGSSDLGHLVDEYRRAGLDVTNHWEDPLPTIDGPIGTAVHRIAREALANVARHAPTNHVHLTIEVHGAEQPGGQAIVLRVVDRGVVSPHARRPDGFGLIGMRERARALGGDVTAGPTEDGWRVEARLPMLSTESAGKP
jgi:signal transduction histidine kinase